MLRERFGLYPDATCPAGTTMIPPEYLRKVIIACTGANGGKAAICPSGSNVYAIQTETRQQAVICIPSGTATYAPDFTKGMNTWPCQAGDYFGNSKRDATDTSGQYICIPATTATSSSSGSSSTLDTLTTQYTSLKTQYTTLANTVLADPSKMTQSLPTLQSLNQQIASVLDQMLRALQYAKQSPNSDAYRDQLVETLGRIQTDYNGLKTNTDTLETLRRIRGAQDDSWKGPLFIYLMAFLAAAILLVLILVLRRQTKESAAAPSMSPTAIPPLT